MKIEDYFNFYALIKKDVSRVKRFNFLNKQISLITYLKKEKRDIINNINYAFFESYEPYLLSVFSNQSSNYIHINSRLCKEYPRSFDSVYEYENYLAIYGTFAVLLDENFQIESLDDSRMYCRDFLKDLTFRIYYDSSFRLNLESMLVEKNNVLRFVYRYGYDFLLQCFKLFHNDKCEYSRIIEFLNIEGAEFIELYGLYQSKIILEG